MPTLKQQLDKLTELKHKLAVWEATVFMMEETFLSKDGREALKGIRAPDCPVERVPESVIENIVNGMFSGAISELKKQIDNIENKEVTVVGESVNEQTAPKKN